MSLGVWVIDFEVPLQKAGLLIDICYSLCNVGVSCHIVCYCNPTICCTSFFCKGVSMEGVWVSLNGLLPGCSDDREHFQDGTQSASQQITTPEPLGILGVFCNSFVQ